MTSKYSLIVVYSTTYLNIYDKLLPLCVLADWDAISGEGTLVILITILSRHLTNTALLVKYVHAAARKG